MGTSRRYRDLIAQPIERARFISSQTRIVAAFPRKFNRKFDGNLDLSPPLPAGGGKNTDPENTLILPLSNYSFFPHE
ncbi:MAG: hypothetical protein D6812_06220 [Deltaproteobacteria bacterium]|nr:MAG: hypothetical protein D6812_06220 [Deltaproteobacteria bacterium]